MIEGRALLRIKDEEEVRVLEAGDSVLLEPHRLHRVEGTDEKTVWLAVFW